MIALINDNIHIKGSHEDVLAEVTYLVREVILKVSKETNVSKAILAANLFNILLESLEEEKWKKK